MVATLDSFGSQGIEAAHDARRLDGAFALARALRIAPDGIAIIDEDRAWTWREVAERVTRLASAIAAQGVRRGDRVAILALNSGRYAEVLMALSWMGAVANPLNVRFADPELAHCLADSGARVLFFDAACAKTAGRLVQGSPTILHAIPLDEPQAYEGLIKTSEPMPRSAAGPEEPALVVYTGGTTGRSKGVVLTAANIAASVHSMLWTGLGRDGSAAIHIAPMFHVSGALAVFIWTSLGGRHVFLPRFDPADALRLVEVHRPTSLILAPTILQMLFDDPSFADRDLSSVERLIYGMSPMPEALLRRAQALLPKVGFVQCYGQTETTGAVVFLRPEDHVFEGPAAARLRAAGRPHPLAEVAVLDENGRELAPGVAGEICVRGPLAMAGYLGRPELTAETCRGGWLHTGDIGVMDTAGYLFVVDRLKDMIISGGENVYSAEVENALAAHPDVKLCAVVGAPDPLWGERVHAIVTLRPGATAGEADLIAHCRTLIAGYKCPRSVDLRAEDLPLTATGKVAKADLRQSLRPAAGAGPSLSKAGEAQSA